MFRLHRFGAGDDFDQFLGNCRLAGPVIDQRQAVDQVARIAGCVVHRRHPSCEFGSRGFKQGAVDLGRDVARQHRRQQFFLIRLIFIGNAAVIGRRGLVDLGRDQFLKRHFLRNGGFEFVEDDGADVELAGFEAGEFDVCTVIFNKFKSAISQEVTLKKLIPAEVDETAPADDSGVSYEYEPDEEELLAAVLPRNISTQIYSALLESSAAELAARMTAMDNATRNAGDLIDRLTLVYNRTRQATITKELIEIISGAEAV